MQFYRPERKSYEDYCINTSPRKRANTQTLVEAVLEGAAEKSTETRLVNLRELTVHGCLGCEGCKKHLGKCVQKTGIDRKTAANDPKILDKAKSFGAGFLSTTLL